jgi:transcriptional regulator with XRE-family HTH domain
LFAIVNDYVLVRQTEFPDRYSERMGPPLAEIAAAVRRERERAGLTLTELARRAGVAKSTLSQLESGTGNPSVETLWALGVALGVPFSQLLTAPAPAVQVIRAGEGPRIRSEAAEFIGTLLAAGSRHARRDIYRVELVRQDEPSRPRPQRLVASHGDGEAQPSGGQAVSGKVPRNAPCPCGSGQKYKRCHGA